MWGAIAFVQSLPKFDSVLQVLFCPIAITADKNKNDEDK